MCFHELCVANKELVLNALEGLTAKNHMFTGYQVWVLIRDDWVEEPEIESSHGGARRAASAAVRELFNGGGGPMIGYGCMKVGPVGSGPVLYYRPRKAVRERAEVIWKFVEQQVQTIEEVVRGQEEQKAPEVQRDPAVEESGGEEARAS